MFKAKVIAKPLLYIFLVLVFAGIPIFVFWMGKGGRWTNTSAPAKQYKFNELTSEGYPAVIDYIKREAGYEDSETSQVKPERNMIADSAAWHFRLDENFIVVYLLNNQNALASELLPSFSSGGYIYTEPASGNVSKMLWENKPKLYAKDNVLVIYAGSSKEINNIISKVVGKPVVID